MSAPPGNGLVIEPMRPEHWPAVARIYGEGIASGDATFETSVPSWERWDAAHLPEHRLVALGDGEVVGGAALAPVSDRCVYGGVAENSVYVVAEARGRGVGRALLEALVESAEGPASGRSRPASSRRTTPASASTSAAVSASSAGANVSVSRTVSGATSSCSSGAARGSFDGPRQQCRSTLSRRAVSRLWAKLERTPGRARSETI